MYSNLLNLLLFSFFFSFEKGKRAVVNAGRRLRPKQERESRACLRVFFLSEKSTLFCGERVRGAMLRARIFCLWEGRRRRRGRQATDRPQAARELLRAEQHKRSDTRELCGKKGRRLFLGKDRRAVVLSSGWR